MSKSTVKYVDSMPEEARQFYFKKLEVCGPNQQFNVLPDPYTITSDLWSNDPSHWPDLQYGDLYNFLVYKTGKMYIYVVNYSRRRIMGGPVAHWAY